MHAHTNTLAWRHRKHILSACRKLGSVWSSTVNIIKASIRFWLVWVPFGLGTQPCVRCLYSGVSSKIKATKVVIVCTGTFPIELRLMYESRPLLAARAKYRKLSFMSFDAILSGHGWFMSLSGAIEFNRNAFMCGIGRRWFKLGASVGKWGIQCFANVFHIFEDIQIIFLCLLFLAE